MRWVIPPDIQFYYVDQPESKRRLETVYDRIFKIARENIANRSKQKELKDRQKCSGLTTKRHQGNVCVAQRTL